MIFLIEMKDKKRLILGIKIDTQSAIGLAKDQGLTLLMGMFFIYNSSPVISEKSRINDFCLVYPNKIQIFNIEHSTDFLNQIHQISISNSLITNFHYNINCSVLCCERDDNTIAFYNLSQQSFYTSNHIVKIPCLEKTTLGNRFNHFFSKRDTDEQMKILQALKNKLAKYKKSQIFLEVIYGKLCLIYLSYEKNKIYLYTITDLNILDLRYEIDYKQHSFYSTLQFIDNLIVIYNFDRKETIVYDLGLQTNYQLLCVSKNEKFPYSNDILIHGKVIIECNTQGKEKSLMFYHCTLDKSKVFSMYDDKNKHIAIISLLRRKKAKKVICEYLREMIMSRYKMKYLSQIYHELAKQMIIKPQHNGPNVNENILKSNIVLNPNEHIFFGKNVTIQQGDIMKELFKPFQKELNIDEFIIQNIITFYHNLTKFRIVVLPSFHMKLLDSLQNLSLTKFNTFLNNNLLPPSYELAMLLMEYETSDIHQKSIFEQTGLDMLIKLNRLNDVVKYLYQHNRIDEAFFFINKYNQSKDSSLNNRDILINNPEIIRNNIDIFLQYYEEDNKL